QDPCRRTFQRRRTLNRPLTLRLRIIPRHPYRPHWRLLWPGAFPTRAPRASPRPSSPRPDTPARTRWRRPPRPLRAPRPLTRWAPRERPFLMGPLPWPWPRRRLSPWGWLARLERWRLLRPPPSLPRVFRRLVDQCAAEDPRRSRIL